MIFLIAISLNVVVICQPADKKPDEINRIETKMKVGELPGFDSESTISTKSVGQFTPEFNLCENNMPEAPGIICNPNQTKPPKDDKANADKMKFWTENFQYFIYFGIFIIVLPVFIYFGQKHYKNRSKDGDKDQESFLSSFKDIICNLF